MTIYDPHFFPVAQRSASAINERCFACGKPLGTNPKRVETSDGAQRPFVGADCYRKILETSKGPLALSGYQPSRGGPALFPIRNRRDQSVILVPAPDKER